MYLIVGLGNPGTRYRGTRHNIGFRVINLWGQELGVRLTSRRFQSRNIRANCQNNEAVLLRPATFMNESGRSVRACADFYGVEVRKILAIHDDLDLPVGRVKVVRDGGSGGHRGVRSIIEHLGSGQFSRIKIGIGRPRFGEEVEDYVLTPFYCHEKEIIKRVVSLAVQGCELWLAKGVESAMNHINSENLAHKEV
ncbi:MAG: aminoacyl-tRNA hydrolase [Desulfobacteraceae bacterium]|nr:aminoacyl-tRNA hydrolase [Desulfobacteraceae bacterium]